MHLAVIECIFLHALKRQLDAFPDNVERIKPYVCSELASDKHGVWCIFQWYSPRGPPSLWYKLLCVRL